MEYDETLETDCDDIYNECEALLALESGRSGDGAIKIVVVVLPAKDSRGWN